MILTAVFLLLGIVICVLQTSALQMMPGDFARPDLVYLLVAFAAYKLPWVPGILLAFSVGWVLDVLVGVNLGVYPLQFLLVFVCLKFITLKSPVKESAYQIPMVGLSHLLLQLGVYLFSSMTFQYGLPEWSWVSAIQEAILLILAAIPCFLLFSAIQEAILLILAAIPCFLLFSALHENLVNRTTRPRSARRRVQKHL